MQRTRAQPGNTDALELVVPYRTVETQRGRAICRRTERNQEPDATTGEPTNRKRQHPSRWTVEPLDIVDRNQQRSHRGERAKHRHGRRGNRALTRRCIVGARPEERNLERVTLRRRKHGKDLRLDPHQQIRESRVRKRRLHLCGRAPQHANRGRSRRGQRVTPKRRLPDAGLTLEHARGWSLLQGLEKTAEALLLDVPAENDAGHLPRVRTRTTFRKSASASGWPVAHQIRRSIILFSEATAGVM
jgi:hypothetical protein